MSFSKLPDSAYELVAHSIYRKYSNRSICELTQIARERDELAQRASSDIGAGSVGLNKEYSDISMQIEALRKIETTLIDQNLQPGLVSLLQSFVMGTEGSKVVYRNTNFVPDFGGQTLTDFGDVPRRVQSLEETLCSARSILESDIDEFCEFLARIFCSIIEIHPFADANGRTARLLVQVFLRKRNLDFVTIPKYRNSSEWRQCLNEGLEGNLRPMQAFFRIRV